MEQSHYNEMTENYNKVKSSLDGKDIFLFGHCEASLSLIDLLLSDGYQVRAILDNNGDKYGTVHRGIPVVPPMEVLDHPSENTTVLIVIRFYEAMRKQLLDMGFEGTILRLVDHNTFAEYSFSEDTYERKRERLNRGRSLLDGLKKEHPDLYMIFCPFNALGDVYLCASYLPYFLERRNIKDYMICVLSEGCRKVARLFGTRNVTVIARDEMDPMIQAVIHDEPDDAFVAHQDRPYVMNMHKALKIKRITLEDMYRCGVFGLDPETAPVLPTCWKEWTGKDNIEEGKTVILSPYAKSVIALPDHIWQEITDSYGSKGFKMFTNVSGDEKPLPGTEPLRAELSQMKSLLELAGTFIGIRSGLCDVIKTVNCKKTALYPDYNYGDTKWKAIEMYALEGFDNIVVNDRREYQWISN
ncbi:MAG: hypothetical protein K6F34_09665 [Lachnospiraceae bacterium]|nr:hypothetical protein [Lachnospiraceae bacterium]